MTRLDTSQGPGAMESDRSKTACVTSAAPSSPGRGGWGAGGRCAYTLLGPSVRSR